MKNEIKSEKILVGKIFSEMWFRIPEYQRPYVWGNDQVSELLDDVCYAMLEKPDSEYFLGSFVFQSQKTRSGDGVEFSENDLLDGQQRMTTLFLLFAVLRDRLGNEKAMKSCQKRLFQEQDEYDNIPERLRIMFAIRNDAQEFIESLAKADQFTLQREKLAMIGKNGSDISIRNMAKAILNIHEFFDKDENQDINLDKFLQFLLNNVLLIYVSTENLEDAFRLFTILNDRGVPLRNSDILKSINLGALASDQEKEKYAKLWEDAESELGDDFDRFLSHVRAILVKDKARLSLLQEYEDKIYDPKEREKSTGNKRPPLLQKGKETFEFIKKHLENYKKITSENNYGVTGDFSFDNLIKTMFTGLPSTDWVPPFLRYYDKFEGKNIYEFLVLLDNKFSADWISQLTPTARIEAMNNITKEIDKADSYVDVLRSDKLRFDADKLFSELEGKIYGRRFARYILLKLDYLYKNQEQRMSFETISIEHILPQNPSDDSQWKKDFSDESRDMFTDKIGNLVLISRKKNTSQGRLDYKEKKEKYFKNNIDNSPNSLRVLQEAVWDIATIQKNQKTCLEKLKSHYK